MKNLKTSCVLLLACFAAQANASVITLQTAYSAAGSQTGAAAYKDVVERALLSQGAGYGTKTISSYTNISNTNQFSGGANSNIAWKATIDFSVATAGTWTFRTGVDFGNGGALFLDGVALTASSTDMYWGNSYTNASQYLQAVSQLAAGNHKLTIYGLESCCDGVQQAQFKAGSAAFATFAANDGISPKAVPEPATLATMGLGLGLLAGLRRRGKRG
ncbi:CCXG family PEP-CTERM protein [Massilia sp. TN1-12]|uniref:CCXG family PEP-CTERM protein n=1 Tax=Massilia paldalensis TaxID=3377675 RepID=UPI00384BB1F4